MDDSRCDDGKSIRFCKALTLAVQPRVDRKCEQPHGQIEDGISVGSHVGWAERGKN